MPKERHMEGPAGIFKRILAFVIDMLLVDIVIISPFGDVLSRSFPADYSKIRDLMTANPDLTGKLLGIIIAITILALLYFALTEHILGQTLGKMLMNIYVVAEKGKPSLFHCLLRSMFLIPVFPFILLWIADPIAMAFTKNSTRLSEILSKTRTIELYKMV